MGTNILTTITTLIMATITMLMTMATITHTHPVPAAVIMLTAERAERKP